MQKEIRKKQKGRNPDRSGTSLKKMMVTDRLCWGGDRIESRVQRPGGGSEHCHKAPDRETVPI